ncbi:peptide chain release factor 3 [Bacillus solimangrovi]|uniref:Peptide chain release factor 3 n=1 Tax=Bacillus solimangrovi TaxID=1305675 RepID=A0A1E5LCF1_9BACI|nr:peptide chain release factor 3 [Bacillus solimangrovi]OEH91679.1 peptide chain release factor 3 [Bacillus solimangrovi]
MSKNETILPRRTFAIISHPDAGKTTLTEKFLHLGGMLRSAGTVKGKKTGKYATSDWMEIEKQRGISVTSSVIQFIYQDNMINLLDTPGHEDFSEDTYRTLTAVDTAVMVIDGTKGIEEQTVKLFKVCKMRGIPILTFINKLDREGKDPLELLEEIEDVLGIETYPVTWPSGMGKGFNGVYNRFEKRFEKYDENGEGHMLPLDIDGETNPDALDEMAFEQLQEEVMLLEEAGDAFSKEKVAAGELTPVFFGSAITGFGVQSFLDAFIHLSNAPQPRNSTIGEIGPEHEEFSGFIFKIQANMNPAHRDRIAFLRVCSGEFERGMTVKLTRTGKAIKLSQSSQFFAASRETVDKAYPGDIIGIYDTGNYQIGDTLAASNGELQFEALPTFPPELFAKVYAKNALKQKHFYKGIEQLVQEGAIQLYKTPFFEDYIIGAVGELQFQVFEHRMNNEYNVNIVMERQKYGIAKWIVDGEVKDNISDSRKLLVKDQHERSVLLFENDFSLRWFEDKNPDIKLGGPERIK